MPVSLEQLFILRLHFDHFYVKVRIDTGKGSKVSISVSELSIWILGFGIKTTLVCLSVFYFFALARISILLCFSSSLILLIPLA